MENYGSREAECLEPREAKLIAAEKNQPKHFPPTFKFCFLFLLIFIQKKIL
jgi:hypothetical protein